MTNFKIQDICSLEGQKNYKQIDVNKQKQTETAKTVAAKTNRQKQTCKYQCIRKFHFYWFSSYYKK